MLSLDFKKYISITEKQGFSAWAHSRAALSAGRVSKHWWALDPRAMAPSYGDPSLGLSSSFLAAFPSGLIRTSSLAWAPQSYSAHQPLRTQESTSMHVHLGPATSQVPFPLFSYSRLHLCQWSVKLPSPLPGQPSHRLFRT